MQERLRRRIETSKLLAVDVPADPHTVAEAEARDLGLHDEPVATPVGSCDLEVKSGLLLPELREEVQRLDEPLVGGERRDDEERIAALGVGRVRQREGVAPAQHDRRLRALETGSAREDV